MIIDEPKVRRPKDRYKIFGTIGLHFQRGQLGTINHSNSGKSARFWKNCFILSAGAPTRIVKASKCCMISIMGSV